MRRKLLLSGLAALGLILGAVSPALASSILAREVFYNNSGWDGTDAALNAGDDAAIAPDKTALLPGGTATFANYTTFILGLNGLMIDVDSLADAGALSASDFAFRVGNGSDLSLWTTAPAPSALVVRTGAGVGGSDRISLAWSDHAIEDQWLEVTLGATSATGLASADVFYFGNLAGDANGDASLSTMDPLVLTNWLNAGEGGPTTITDPYDLNRDGTVGASDELAAINLLESKGPQSLELITPVVPEPATLLQLGLGLAALVGWRRRIAPRR